MKRRDAIKTAIGSVLAALGVLAAPLVPKPADTRTLADPPSGTVEFKGKRFQEMCDRMEEILWGEA